MLDFSLRMSLVCTSFICIMSLAYRSRPSRSSPAAGGTIGGEPCMENLSQPQSLPGKSHIQCLIDLVSQRPGPLTPTQNTSAGSRAIPASELAAGSTEASLRPWHSLMCPCAQSTSFSSFLHVLAS